MSSSIENSSDMPAQTDPSQTPSPFSDTRVIQDGDTVTRVESAIGQFILVGTAHVSEDSAIEVDRLIQENSPRVVCIELDANRLASLNEENSWKNLDVFKVIRQKKTFLLLSNLVLSAYQKRMGVDLGTKPGDEMRAAIASAEAAGVPTAMVDRDIQLTLSRAWRKSGFWGRNKILAVLISSAFSREKLDDQTIEELKSRSALDEMMREMADFLPSVKEVLIDERDQYLAIKSWQAAKQPADAPILAVVGAGHVPGMTAKLLELDDMFRDEQRRSELKKSSNERISEISSLPARSFLSKLAPWLVVALILGLIVSGFITKGWQGGLQGLWRWVLVNGSLSALGALVALAHPITIISSFIAAPITSMNPTIGVGFVTGLLETLLRKPRVEDFESLGDDILSFKGFFRNRVTRILLVFLFSTLGSFVGTVIGIPLLFP